jgi:lipopolysaccharide/colanic/teichoic acid biosynthesis glycosyltransferase
MKRCVDLALVGAALVLLAVPLLVVALLNKRARPLCGALCVTLCYSQI